MHRRSLEYEVFDHGESLAVVGTLRDTRPWAVGSDVSMVHDMALQVSVRIDDLTITEARAHMHTFPHTECPGIVAAFAGLVGIGVTRGYTRQVQQRFGGPKGCTHLEQLARSLGPVVVQAVTSRRAQAMSRGEADDLLADTGKSLGAGLVPHLGRRRNRRTEAGGWDGGRAWAPTLARPGLVPIPDDRP